MMLLFLFCSVVYVAIAVVVVVGDVAVCKTLVFMWLGNIKLFLVVVLSSFVCFVLAAASLVAVVFLFLLLSLSFATFDRCYCHC